MKLSLKIFLLLTSILFSTLIWGQNSRLVTGTVIDEDGFPVIGAGVSYKGATKNSAATDVDGKFSISIPNDSDVVIFSFIGMETLEYKLGEKITNLNITMKYSNSMLDELVVTGYAQTTVKKITGSVGILKSDKFENQPVASIGAIMQGEIAGVSIQSYTGQPGVQQNIRIRGVNNLSGNSNPLWVVDGVPLQNDVPALSSEELKTGGFDNIFIGGVGNVNPNDVESVTVLKDAAAAAIYGSRAANGVIVITTKRGKEGKMSVGYTNNFTVSFAPRDNLSLMDSQSKLNWEQELWDEFSAQKYIESQTDSRVFYPVVGIVGQIRAGVGPYASIKDNPAAQDAIIDDLSKINTNWYDLLFRNTFSQNHYLSLSGGGSKSTYYVSLGFTDDNGMLIGNDYQRFSMSSKLNIKPSEWSKIDVGVDLSRQSSLYPDSNVDPFIYAYFANPYEAAYNADMSYAADNTFFSLPYYNGDTDDILPSNGFNILRELDNNFTETVNWATTARASIELNLLEQLKFTGLASYSFSNNKTDKVVHKDTYTAFKDRLGNDKYTQNTLYGSISQNSANRDSYVLRGYFTYNDDFWEDHSLSILAGVEVRGSSSNTIFTKRYNYDPITGTSSFPEPSGEIDAWIKSIERLNGQYFTDNRYASFYASADYFIKDAYVINFSFRSDGSSNFGSDRQFNPNWSAGAAWHIKEENFLKNVDNISHLTLRASAGYTGDVNTSTTPQLVMQYYQQMYRNYDGHNYLLGYIPTAPNPNLRWEQTFDTKASIDLGLFKDRITLTAEGYYRLSTDVVTSSQVLSTTGFTSQYYNSADILNSGIEVTLGGKIIKKSDFNLSGSINFAYNYNKVVKYTPAYGSSTSVKDRYVEGYPIGAILAGKLTGIDPTNGLYSFQLRPDADISTTTDLNKTDNYRYYLGTTIAPYSGGFNISASYKSFKLSVGGVYSFGATKYDKIESPASYYDPRHNGVATETVQSQYSDLYSNHLNVAQDRTNRWTEENPNGATYPRIYDYFGQKYNFDYYNPMDYNIVDAIYLKDISYVRIKNIILSYNFDSQLLSKAKIASLGVNLTMNNFFTFTNYDGMDPEIPGATYPTTRSVSLGINLNF